jgi:transposase-like protein
MIGMPESIAAAVLTQGRSKSEVARQYGLSRRWVLLS